MTTKPKCKHKAPRLSYAAYMEDAERRGKSGDKQRKCPICQRWIWNSLWTPAAKPHRNLLASGNRHNEYH